MGIMNVLFRWFQEQVPGKKKKKKGGGGGKYSHLLTCVSVNTLVNVKEIYGM
jgi:hypothetical protein